MVRADAQSPDYLTQLSCGDHRVFADVALEKGGQGSSFRPHDLLEAAFASCLQITMRMYANEHEIALGDSHIVVELVRSDDTTTFVYEVVFDRRCSNDDRERILDVLSRCPVKKTLSKTIAFDLKSSD